MAEYQYPITMIVHCKRYNGIWWTTNFGFTSEEYVTNMYACSKFKLTESVLCIY